MINTGLYKKEFKNYFYNTIELLQLEICPYFKEFSKFEGKIPSKQVYKLKNSDVILNIQEVKMEVLVANNDVVNFSLDKFNEGLYNSAQKMSNEMERYFFDTIQKICEWTGNTLNINMEDKEEFKKWLINMLSRVSGDDNSKPIIFINPESLKYFNRLTKEDEKEIKAALDIIKQCQNDWKKISRTIF